MFSAICVAAHTIADIGNIIMFLLNLILIVFMTAIAGIRIEVLVRMAQLASLVCTTVI